MSTHERSWKYVAKFNEVSIFKNQKSLRRSEFLQKLFFPSNKKVFSQTVMTVSSLLSVDWVDQRLVRIRELFITDVETSDLRVATPPSISDSATVSTDHRRLPKFRKKPLSLILSYETESCGISWIALVASTVITTSCQLLWKRRNILQELMELRLSEREQKLRLKFTNAKLQVLTCDQPIL